MRNKAIKAKAEELLGFGLGKQQVFDNLMLEFPEAKPKNVAEVVRYMPTLAAKVRYRNLHIALMGIIAASALLRVLPPLFTTGFHLDQATAYLSLVPIATLLVGWTLFRWQGQVFEWVGWGNLVGGLGIFRAILQVVSGGGEPWSLVFKVMSVLVGLIALLLARKVFTKPKVTKDPMGETAPRYLFPEEGMGLS